MIYGIIFCSLAMMIFDEWESDDYPPNTIIRDTRNLRAECYRQTFLFLDELDEMYPSNSPRAD